MNVPRTLVGAALLCTLIPFVATLPAVAQEPSPEEMMMEKVVAPGPHHEMMMYQVGDWDSKATFWMDPDCPPYTGRTKDDCPRAPLPIGR